MIRSLLLLLALTGPVLAQAPDTSARPAPRGTPPPVSDFASWLDGFRARAEAQGIRPATVDSALADIRFLPDVIRRDRSQNEFTKTLWAYLDTAVSDLRVTNGRRALARHAKTLSAIEARHGVPAEIVVAIWGLESSYGAVRGGTSTLSALATLAFDPRRAEFFEQQLLDALRILDAGDTSAARLRGSWAGAMGHTQFMPTSFLAHAQDWTGDGRRDIWGDDPRDALASTAAYLAANGWIAGLPWGTEVTLPDGFDYRLTGERVTRPTADWQTLGVRATTGSLPGTDALSIRVPAGHEGAAFATTANFRVLETYNTADAYVIAVGHLADRIAGGPPIRAGFPRQDRALTFEERVEMQRLLADRGFDPEKFDGLVGPLTLDAIQRWQAATGLVPDGYVDPDLLARLRDG
ncbi:lytic murein transglycosylase [Jannaschia sp. M317]|uniref:lytic murein transglycosylase n=1 Tax=Jannaschia sp. M317 TaxID=2867011 RepID=UPI0021A4C7A5|nr:lytic murein transglycosylase [Jannaschia sp. M317]UWQ18578.1 lytic murein transglycosylase [Jannaschia sp. M317]